VGTPRRLDDLSDYQLLDRLRACVSDCVVACATCATDHRLDALAVDVFAAPPRYFLCPLCRNDLAAAVRDHAETHRP
jgi:hypothetical protein